MTDGQGANHQAAAILEPAGRVGIGVRNMLVDQTILWELFSILCKSFLLFYRINMTAGHMGKNRLLVSMISAKQVSSYSSLVIIPERITSDSKKILCSSCLGFILNNKKQTLLESIGSLYLETTVQAK